ncbi:MAG: TrmH family RNA methyltransferase [Flavobacteriales bacterium]
MSISKNEIKLIRSLQQKKFRMQEQLFVVEGRKAVEEALGFESSVVKAFTSDEDFSVKFKVPLIHERDMEQISSLTQPPGYLAVLKQKNTALHSIEGKTFCVANAISDPGNLGTLIRTCEWFGVDALLLDDQCVDVYNPKVVQATMGSVLRLSFASATSDELIEYFRLKEISMLAADLNGMPIQSFKAPEKWALVVGSESHGVSEQFVEASATRLTIPSMGSAESLNASIAGGIAIFQLKVNA